MPTWSWTRAALSLKFGGIIMLLGSLAMAVGAFMVILGKGTNLVAIPGLDSSGGRCRRHPAAASAAASAAAASGRSAPSSAAASAAGLRAQSPATISAISSPASVGLRPTFTPAAAQGVHLPLRRALAPGDDGAGVAHLLARPAR